MKITLVDFEYGYIYWVVRKVHAAKDLNLINVY